MEYELIPSAPGATGLAQPGAWAKLKKIKNSVKPQATSLTSFKHWDKLGF